MKPRKLLARITITQAIVKFADFIRLIVALGFRHMRTTGSHRSMCTLGAPKRN